MLEAEPDLRVIGEAADAAAAAKLVGDRRPDVLVLDLQMPGAEPRSDVPRLRETVPGTAIVVLTMQSDPRAARDLLRAGAAGYVLKQAAERKLDRGDPRRRRRRLLRRPASWAGRWRSSRPTRCEGLSERELELLRLVALGHTNREIGESLFLSVRAIEVNRAKLLEKLGVELAPRAGPLRDRPRRDRAGPRG